MVASTLLFLYQLSIVDRTNRETKRFANQAFGPILTNANELSNARISIQSMKLGAFFVARHCQVVR